MVDKDRLREELKRMRRLIKNDPKVLTRFDTDGNGVIDGHEWEAVRQLVIRRLERREADEAARAKAEASAETPLEAEPKTPDVATEILHGDLAASHEPSLTGLLTEHTELIIVQRGGIGQILEGMTRRTFEILSRSGRVIASIQQVENQALQNLGRIDVTSLPDLNFELTTPTGAEAYRFCRSTGIGAPTRIDVYRGEKAVAFARRDTSFTAQMQNQISAHSVTEKHGLTLRNKLWKPHTYGIEDAFDRKVGVLQRGWSGLGGLLSGGNQSHIKVSPEERSPEIRLALIAAALLVELDRPN